MKKWIKWGAAGYAAGGALNLLLWALHSRRDEAGSGLSADYGLVIPPTYTEVANQFFLWPKHIVPQVKAVLGITSTAGDTASPPIDTSTPVLEPGGAIAPVS